MKNESLGKDYDWEIAVDNGVYYVEITAGDPDGDSSDPNIYSSCRYILKAEGEEVLDGVPTSSKRWISGSAMITVTDGRLTISGDSGASHNCISYVKFLKSPTGEMPSSVGLEFAYDGRGNLLEDAHFEYAWDGSDRIVEITDKSWETGDNGPEKISYVYDAMGRRVLTRWHYENSTTQYAMVYDGVAPIEQGEISEGVVQRFYYEAGINKPALVEKYDATGLEGAYVPLADDRGTVVGVYDVKVGNSTYGQLVEKLHYNATGLCKSFDPNGVENLTPGTDINLGRSFYDIPFGWCGMARDAFTGLYHTHFRDYDPVHGRWLSEDPAGYQDGLNLYAAYMGVNGVDLLGLDLRRMGGHEKFMHTIVSEETDGMETGKRKWVQSDPSPGKKPHSGAFGIEVHRRASSRIAKEMPGKFVNEVFVDTETKKILSIGVEQPKGFKRAGTTQVDLVCMKGGNRLKVGDIWNEKKIKFIADIKTGKNMTRKQREKLLELVDNEKRLKTSTPARKWTKAKGWHQNSKHKKIARLFAAYGAANALYAMAHVGEYDRELKRIEDLMKEAQRMKRDSGVNGAFEVLIKYEMMNAVTNYMRHFTIDDTALDVTDMMALYYSLGSD